MEGGDWRQGGVVVGGPVNDCMSCWRTAGWCWVVGGVVVVVVVGERVGLGDMISQEGLQEVRVGLTCIRIKQCWEAEFFRGSCGVVGGATESTHSKQ